MNSDKTVGKQEATPSEIAVQALLGLQGNTMALAEVVEFLDSATPLNNMWELVEFIGESAPELELLRHLAQTLSNSGCTFARLVSQFHQYQEAQEAQEAKAGEELDVLLAMEAGIDELTGLSVEGVEYKGHPDQIAPMAPAPKVYKYSLGGTTYAVVVQRTTYANGRTALVLNNAEDGSPFTKVSINMPEVELQQNEIIVKNHSENVGMDEWLAVNKIAEYTGLIPMPHGGACPTMHLLPPFAV